MFKKYLGYYLILYTIFYFSTNIFVVFDFYISALMHFPFLIPFSKFKKRKEGTNKINNQITITSKNYNKTTAGHKKTNNDVQMTH